MQVFRWCEVPPWSSLWKSNWQLGTGGNLVLSQQAPCPGACPAGARMAAGSRFPEMTPHCAGDWKSMEECLLGIHCHGRSCEQCKLPHLSWVAGMSSLLPVESRSSSFIGFIGLIPQLNVLKSSWMVSLSEILVFFPPFWLYVKSI